MDATETRPLTPAGRRIAAAAEELFYERGITGVGVDLIAEHSGVTKRTLYNQFGSKDHLVAVYLAERDRRWRSLVQATVDARATPRDAVLAPFDALATEALGAADTASLAGLDPVLAEELGAAGRAPWQVLAGAAAGAGLSGKLLYDEAPYGVGYFVAAWS
ncbi:TetR family transcriptional regulator [Streptomyces albidoflavus]|uniref:TetR family transcriptional regulator n=1 Tax=Streptomyces albidoflavus TaxID=1886 RepID=UPI000BB66107|nr:TetR family transcriptional regulator [Streptomyces albidoflavus]PBO30235.1 TetR family transcriptional regulator [Streptomyces albidoflavus]